MRVLIFFPYLLYVLLFEGIFVGLGFHVVDDYGGDDASDAAALDRQDVVRVACLAACLVLRLCEVQVSQVLHTKDICSYLD